MSEPIIINPNQAGPAPMGTPGEAQTQALQAWLQDHEAKLNQLAETAQTFDGVFQKLFQDLSQLLNVLIGLAGRVENVTGQKIINVVDSEGKPINMNVTENDLPTIQVAQGPQTQEQPQQEVVATNENQEPEPIPLDTMTPAEAMPCPESCGCDGNCDPCNCGEE